MDKYIKNTKIMRLPHFLADTWWFALTKRLNDEDFLKLVKTREKQGFTAAQIVVGIPPEVGIKNENASSIFGSAWNEKGEINKKYLELAKKRIKIMNDHNIKAIVYGAWGHQIEWIGTEKMINWWKTLIEELDKEDIIYCLTGEIDIWCDPISSKILLPDKSTQNVIPESKKTNNTLKKIYNKIFFNENSYRKRRIKKWNKVLENIRNYTNRPMLIHTLPTSSGFDVTHKIEMISANTFQTGHTRESKDEIWQNIYTSITKYPNKPVINLEPYYEGIHNDFFGKWQLDAFWLSISSGAYSICYGAHGIWNVGDGNFLSQWGKQTFKEALELKTPEILGKTYKVVLEQGILDWQNVSINKIEDKLLSISRMSKEGKKMTYIPDISIYRNVPKGRYFKVETAEFTLKLPETGAIVVFN